MQPDAPAGGDEVAQRTVAHKVGDAVIRMRWQHQIDLDAAPSRQRQRSEQRRVRHEVRRHRQNPALRGELAEQKAKAAADAQAHADYRARMEQDAARITELLGQAKEAQEVARHDASEARESAAKLAGQLEAVQAQNATLLAAVQQRSDRGSGGK